MPARREGSVDLGGKHLARVAVKHLERAKVDLGACHGRVLVVIAGKIVHALGHLVVEVGHVCVVCVTLEAVSQRGVPPARKGSGFALRRCLSLEPGGLRSHQ